MVVKDLCRQSAFVTHEVLQVCDKHGSAAQRMAVPAVLACSALIFLAAAAFADCAPPAAGPSVCLTGTVTSPGYDGALIEHPGESAVERLRTGDAVMDWKVVKIGPGYMVLSHGAQQVQLTIGNDAPTAAQTGTGPMRRPHTHDGRAERNEH